MSRSKKNTAQKVALLIDSFRFVDSPAAGTFAPRGVPESRRNTRTDCMCDHCAVPTTATEHTYAEGPSKNCEVPKSSGGMGSLAAMPYGFETFSTMPTTSSL